MYEDIVVRSYFVPVQDTERFFLSKILRYKKCCLSFKDVKTVNNITCSTYREVAN